MSTAKNTQRRTESLPPIGPVATSPRQQPSNALATQPAPDHLEGGTPSFRRGTYWCRTDTLLLMPARGEVQRLDPVVAAAMNQLTDWTYHRYHAVHRRLRNVPLRFKGLRDPSSRSGAIHMLKNLEYNGYPVHPDDLRKWAIEHGWKASDARDLSATQRAFALDSAITPFRIRSDTWPSTNGEMLRRRSTEIRTHPAPDHLRVQGTLSSGGCLQSASCPTTALLPYPRAVPAAPLRPDGTAIADSRCMDTEDGVAVFHLGRRRKATCQALQPD